MDSPSDVESRVEQLAQGTDLGWVADVLSGRRDEILIGWLQAAIKQPFHAMRPERAVADHIPAPRMQLFWINSQPIYWNAFKTSCARRLDRRCCEHWTQRLQT